jgi:copper chaperone NosL
MMRNLILVYIIGILILSCSTKPDFKPRAIDHDHDLCAKCLMKIGEDNYVVQTMNKYGDVKFFDDFGCFVKYTQGVLWERFSQGEKPNTWITDAETGEWLEIENAFFRYGDKSPMNFGFGALKQENADVMSYEAAMKQLKDNNFSKLDDKFTGILKNDTLGQKNEMGKKDEQSSGKCSEGKCGPGKCGG